MRSEKVLHTAGARLRRARLLAGIHTRREFQERYHISANTLQGWEQGKNPLSEKGARRVVVAFKDEGLICSTEWLLHGTGMPPRPYEMLNAGIKRNSQEDGNLSELNLREEEIIYKETQFFKQVNPHAIVLNIADDAMEPFYCPGDYIGGVQLSDYEVEKFIGNICIVELPNNLIVPRLLQKGKRPNTFNVCCTNPRTRATPLNYYDIEVVSVSPVTWHRKKLSTLQG